MANRRCNHLIDKPVDSLVVSIFKQDANEQHQNHHQQGGDQRGK